MEKVDKNATIKITCVGDIMCKKQQLVVSKKENKYDFYECFKHMKNTFEDADYLVGNLETPISSNYDNLTKEQFSFSTPPEFLDALSKVGFNLVSTANNHCLDRGINGLMDTIKELDKRNISHVGTYASEKDRNQIFYITIKGIKLAFISYTYGTNANINGNYLNETNSYLVNLFKRQEKRIRKYNILRRFKRKYLKDFFEEKFNYKRDQKYLNQVVSDIKQAKSKADYVFFCMHSGGQYNEVVEDYTIKLMDFLIDNGVDFVVGAHPHVVHGSKKYSNKEFGAYSLGNFYSVPFANPSQKNELADYSIILNFYLSKGKNKITYSLAKSVKDDNGFTRVYPLKEIYDKEKDKEKKKKLLMESQEITKTFCNQVEDDILEEYIV